MLESKFHTKTSSIEAFEVRLRYEENLANLERAFPGNMLQDHRIDSSLLTVEVRWGWR